MIIKSLRASHFMKFKDINIKHLPETGEIAVIGENEAGKTTLGECFAFALFGRTVRTEETDPAQVINWNADECETSICVKVADKGIFQIDRTVSRSGAISAKVQGPDGSVLAEDVATVNKILPRILGFNFPEFRYSFYVAQKEIDIVAHARRDNTRQIVYDMLGISSVDRARNLVESEITEFKQKTETLDRDLAVATALRTSVAVEEETLKKFDNQKLQVEDEIGKGLAVEKQAREDLDRNRSLLSSHREVLRSFERFQNAFLINHYKSYLSRFAASLEATRKFTDTVATETNKEILRDEKNYTHTNEKIGRLRAATILVRELKALIQSRHNYLAAELKERDASGENFQPRTKAEYKTATENQLSDLGGSVKSNTLGLVIFALLGLGLAGFGGAVLGKAVEIGADALPMGLTAQPFGVFLVVVGVIFIFVAISQFLRRSKAAEKLKKAEDSLATLRQDLQKISDESAACSGYRDDQMNQIEAQVRRINNETIDRKFDELQSNAKELLESTGSVEDMLKSELEKEKSLREARDKLNPRLSLANRMRRQAQDALEGLNKAIENMSLEGEVDSAIEASVKKQDLNAIEKPLEDLTRKVTQGLVVLDSLMSTGSAKATENSEQAKAEAAKTMHQSLVGFFKLCKDASDRQSNFESRSRLPVLLKTKGDTSPEEVKEGLLHEGKLLREVLRDVSELDSAVAEAEKSLQKASEKRAKAENERVSLFARTENLREQMARCDELTVKIAGLENALNPIARDLAIRQELLKLFDETVEGMKARFGPNLARYIELLLPRITGNRYRRVQLTPDLDIKVYSSERADYVKLIDLSFGTSDQILLALRLGLAQALVHSRGIRNGEQFMFLDEPLAAFDESRSQAFLQLMRTFDDNFAQIFVSSTTPLEGHNFEAQINLKVSQGELMVSTS